jgi:hypothetical protein
MERFGEVNTAVMFAGHAYIWFCDRDDAVRTKGLINNMAIEGNIIKATVV